MPDFDFSSALSPRDLNESKQFFWDRYEVVLESFAIQGNALEVRRTQPNIS